MNKDNKPKPWSDKKDRAMAECKKQKGQFDVCICIVSMYRGYRPCTTCIAQPKGKKW